MAERPQSSVLSPQSAFSASPHRGLARLRNAKRRRASSWDRTGGNRDCITVARGETVVLADIAGAGCVTHIWFTIASDDPLALRNLALRMYWDGETSPSVETPVGDFFGMGHAMTRNFATPMLAMSPQDGRGLNCYFPMPFAAGARITLTNDGETACRSFYFYIDYEEYTALEDGLGRFHAWWHRENPTVAEAHNEGDGKNLTGAGNYLIMEATGKGHYVGCHLDYDNVHEHTADASGAGLAADWSWYGEGDDMMFIDGDEMPTLTGTGTEDYYGCAWCPSEFYVAPYHGILLPGGANWAGKITVYRYHIEDPVMFDTSLRVTIEHGHANDRSDDLASTAYWYQTEPHAPFPPLPDTAARAPRPSRYETRYIPTAHK